MKKLIYFLSICLMMLSACDNGSETEVKDITPTAHKADTVDLGKKFNTLSDNIRILFRSPQGVFRTIDFNSTQTQIAQGEDSLHVELAKNEANLLSYHLTFNVLEEGEISYLFNSKGNLVKIEADIFPKDQKAQNAMYNEIQFYLTGRWGSATEKAENIVTWKLMNPSMEIILKKAGNDKVYDLELDFISGTNSASN